ncbi:MAG: ribose-phosphate diphosphokinase [Candidatus Micrarchaeota archaeon]
MRNSVVVGCSNSKRLARSLAKKLDVSYSDLFTDRFPDGEKRIRFNARLENKTVFLVQSLHPCPNGSLVELVFAIETAKELGAFKVFAIVPYFAYARQDFRFNPGEAVSNRIVARMIEQAGADGFITVNTHLHRIKNLREIFSIPSDDVLLSKEIADYAKKKIKGKVLVVGPDWESTPLVKEIAKLLHSDHYVFKKKRLSGTRVKSFETPGLDCRGKSVLLVDDIASTCNTLVSVTKILKKNGAKKVDCVVTHLLEEGGAKKALKNGVSSIVCSNTLENKFSKMDASGAIAQEIGF